MKDMYELSMNYLYIANFHDLSNIMLEETEWFDFAPGDPDPVREAVQWPVGLFPDSDIFLDMWEKVRNRLAQSLFLREVQF